MEIPEWAKSLPYQRFNVLLFELDFFTLLGLVCLILMLITLTIIGDCMQQKTAAENASQPRTTKEGDLKKNE